MSHAYIPDKESMRQLIREAVKETVNEALPGAIRKATRKKWITTDEVADILQVSIRHIQHLRDAKQLPYSQSGRTIRYNIDDVEAFLNNHKVGGRK